MKKAKKVKVGKKKPETLLPPPPVQVTISSDLTTKRQTPDVSFGGEAQPK